MSNFDFELLTRTNYYKRHTKDCIKKDYTRDICIENILNPKREDYLKVVQKSNLWLNLRSRSHGTASSLGKFLIGDKFLTTQQLNENWNDFITKKPFEKTQTMEAHMKWGTTYEDLALFCFAEQYKVCVNQVGTIRVDYTNILDNYKLFFPSLPFLEQTQEEHHNYHLLISPDGIVGKREKQRSKEDFFKLSDNIIGMLEIKCMSPFYHLENENGNLVWCQDIEKRQWSKVEDIPFVYLIQMTLQAVSGIIELDMNMSDKMYFERWSPKGFSVFVLPFSQLFKVGLLCSTLYFKILSRSKEQDFKAYPLLNDEQIIQQEMEKQINILNSMITHEYHDITEKHPYQDIFNNYFLQTQYNEFNMHPQQKIKSKEQSNNVCLI